MIRMSRRSLPLEYSIMPLVEALILHGIFGFKLKTKYKLRGILCYQQLSPKTQHFPSLSIGESRIDLFL